MGALTYTTAQVQALLDEVDDKTAAVTENSTDLVTSGGVYAKYGNVTSSVTEDSGDLVTSGAVYAVCGDVESVLEALL